MSEREEKVAVNISVRSLVEFILRSGDIDNRITGQMQSDAMAEGSKIHRKIQGQMGPEYKPEVPLKINIDYEEFCIRLEGRADGIITEEEGVTIDEIKGMYKNVKKMQQPVEVHRAQAMCYAYIYGVQNGCSHISVQLTYCNLEDESIKRFREAYSLGEVETYFEKMISRYVIWARFILQEKKIRRESIQQLSFPFVYRKGQKNIVAYVYRAIENQKTLFIQAPTGVGKTISTVYPAIRAVGEDKADKIFYLTAKTITRTVAEEAFDTLREKGLHFKTVTITAKEKICSNCDDTSAMDEGDGTGGALEKPIVECNPVKCSRAKGHFDRINEALFDIITHENAITREVILQYAGKHQVCPFEFSLDISNFMGGVICEYNYVFDPHVRLKRYFADGAKGDYVFLVDEAHNLVERAREMYSATLVKEDLLRCKKIVKEKRRGLATAFEKCNREMLKLKRISIGQQENDRYSYTILKDTEELVKQLLRLLHLLEEFLDDDKDFEGRELILEEYFAIRNYLDVYELSDDKYEIYSDFGEEGEFFVKLFCVNPSGNLSECMRQGIASIFFSATLLPVNYYKELLSGQIEDDAIYIDSPFDTGKRLLAVASDVSSRYTRRGREEYLKILQYIDAVCGKARGNYMVFFPSYQILREVEQLALERGFAERYHIICQQSGMKERERDAFLANFDGMAKDKTLIGFCVLGGIFSEGIDLKNERLIGSIIVGTGLPMMCAQRDILKRHYDSMGKDGFDYAYRYPGMNKVLQAAGRVIRTQEDYGVIVLLDERFLQKAYKTIFPREWGDCKVTDKRQMENEVERYWKYLSSISGM